jgi:Protein of unknown function (DUF3311)
MRPKIAALLVALLYVLHQDFWFWNTARPLVLGFLPIGLFYHAAFTLASAGVLWLLVTRMWPDHLEHETEARATLSPRGPSSPKDPPQA